MQFRISGDSDKQLSEHFVLKRIATVCWVWLYRVLNWGKRNEKTERAHSHVSAITLYNSFQLLKWNINKNCVSFLGQKIRSKHTDFTFAFLSHSSKQRWTQSSDTEVSIRQVLGSIAIFSELLNLLQLSPLIVINIRTKWIKLLDIIISGSISHLREMISVLFQLTNFA